MTTATNALRIKVAEPQEGGRFCAAAISFDDGTVASTPIPNFTELRAKASDLALDMNQVVASPATIRWLKDQEGWPGDRETVGRV